MEIYYLPTLRNANIVTIIQLYDQMIKQLNNGVEMANEEKDWIDYVEQNILSNLAA